MLTEYIYNVIEKGYIQDYLNETGHKRNTNLLFKNGSFNRLMPSCSVYK